MKIVNTLKEAIPVMIEALVSGDLVLVDNLLVKYPRLIELRDKQGRTLLMIVAYLGSPGIVNYFISFHVIATQNIDIEAVDDDELNAYDWAVLGGNEFAVSLISRIADPGDRN